MKRTFAVAIGGAAGQGVATPGDIFAKLFVRRGLHVNAYSLSVDHSGRAHFSYDSCRY
jgi:Pyruvate/2-oxoacid:ferredoxin oxidoreductase gamma subunit